MEASPSPGSLRHHLLLQTSHPPAPDIGQLCHRISRGGSSAGSTTPAGETLSPILSPTPSTPTARIHVLPSSRERKTPQILLSPPQWVQNEWEESNTEH